jgi:hypothetical protein
MVEAHELFQRVPEDLARTLERTLRADGPPQRERVVSLQRAGSSESTADLSVQFWITRQHNKSLGLDEDIPRYYVEPPISPRVRPGMNPSPVSAAQHEALTRQAHDLVVGLRWQNLHPYVQSALPPEQLP